MPDTNWLGIYLGVGVAVVSLFLPTIFPGTPLPVARFGYTVGVLVIGWSIWRYAMPHKPFWMRCLVVTPISLILLGLEACGIYRGHENANQSPGMNGSASQLAPASPALSIPNTNSVPPASLAPDLSPSLTSSNPVPSAAGVPNQGGDNGPQINIGRDNNGIVIGGNNNGSINQGPRPRLLFQRLETINVPHTNETGVIYETTFSLGVENATPQTRFHFRAPAGTIGTPNIALTQASQPVFGPPSAAFIISVHTSRKVDESEFGEFSVINPPQ